MKRKFIITFLILSLTGSMFAAGAPKGKNKIGLSLGLPTGVSYSRQLTPLVELDLSAGYDLGIVYHSEEHYRYTWTISQFNFRIAPLFRCWEGGLGSSLYGKLSVGPSVGIGIGTYFITISTLKIGAPVRFDLDFNNIPLNLFCELSLLGVQVSFANFEGGGVHAFPFYYGSFALGVRFRF